MLFTLVLSFVLVGIYFLIFGQDSMVANTPFWLPIDALLLVTNGMWRAYFLGVFLMWIVLNIVRVWW